MAAQTLSVDDDGVMAEINMTPLVDVMLVLLIIFMITMPVITKQLPVQLPQSRAGESVTPTALQIMLQRDGSLWLNQAPVSDAALAEALARAAALAEPPPVHLGADGNVPYKRVMAVMDQVRSSGLTRLGFLTKPDP